MILTVTQSLFSVECPGASMTPSMALSKELSPQSGQSMVKIYLLHKEPPLDPEELLDARELITPQDNCVAALTGPIEKGA